jgi:hypothetical protein
LKLPAVTEFQSNRRVWAVAGLIALATFALYWPAGQFDFVEYDDPDYVFDNPVVKGGLSWWGLVWSFVDAHSSNWHPVTWLSHMADCQVFGLHAGAHHLVNAALHAANGGLLFLVVCSLTGAFWRSAIVAAIFAWHPLRVESVSWISERKDVLSGFFFCCTLLAYGQYAKLRARAERGGESGGSDKTARDSSEPARMKWNFRLALLFFVLGLMSKPMLVTLPAILLLLDYWPLGRIPGVRRWQQMWPAMRPLLKEKAWFFLMAILTAVITVFSQRASRTMVSLHSEGLGLRLVTAVTGYFEYLVKWIWPKPLAVLYLRPERVDVAWLVISIAVLIVISWLVIKLRRPYLTVGWLWYLVMLLPVSGLIQAGLQSIADRYTYLPTIGLGLMATCGLADALEAIGTAQFARSVAVVTAMVALAACVLLTRHQLSYWRNTETLMVHALEVDPKNYIAMQNLANYYARQGKTGKAIQMRERVDEFDPALMKQRR